MSQSSLLKSIFSQKIQNKYSFILYKQKYNITSNDFTPLQICNDHYTTLYFILQYYINELCTKKIIICPDLLKLLNSKKSIQTKINAIITEYKNLFENINSFNVNEFKFRLVKRDNMIFHKILKKQFKKNRCCIKYTLKDYNHFYNYYNRLIIHTDKKIKITSENN